MTYLLKVFGLTSVIAIFAINTAHAMDEKTRKRPHAESSSSRRIRQNNGGETVSLVDISTGCPDILGNILDFLPESSHRALAATCKDLNGLIKGKQGQTSKQLALTGAIKRILIEQLDPVGYVLHQAHGQPEVTVYGYTVKTANLINELLYMGINISRTPIAYAQTDSSCSNMPMYPAFFDALQIPQGVTLDKNQEILCRQQLLIKITADSNFIPDLNKACAENPTAYLYLQFNKCGIDKNTILACKPFPIASLEFRNCTFIPKAMATLGELTQLRQIQIINCQGLNPLFPVELCRLTELTALTIATDDYGLAMALPIRNPIPPEIANLTKLRYLDLSGYEVTLPKELVQLRNSLRALRFHGTGLRAGQNSQIASGLNLALLCATDPYFAPQVFSNLNHLAITGPLQAETLEKSPLLRSLTISMDGKKRALQCLPKILSLKNLSQLQLNLDAINWKRLSELYGLPVRAFSLCGNNKTQLEAIIALAPSIDSKGISLLIPDVLLNIDFLTNHELVHAWLESHKDLHQLILKCVANEELILQIHEAHKEKNIPGEMLHAIANTPLIDTAELLQTFDKLDKHIPELTELRELALKCLSLNEVEDLIAFNAYPKDNHAIIEPLCFSFQYRTEQHAQKSDILAISKQLATCPIDFGTIMGTLDQSVRSLFDRLGSPDSRIHTKRIVQKFATYILAVAIQKLDVSAAAQALDLGANPNDCLIPKALFEVHYYLDMATPNSRFEIELKNQPKSPAEQQALLSIIRLLLDYGIDPFHGIDLMPKPSTHQSWYLLQEVLKLFSLEQINPRRGILGEIVNLQRQVDSMATKIAACKDTLIKIADHFKNCTLESESNT